MKNIPKNVVSIENDYSEVLVSVGKFLLESYLSSRLLNKPSHGHSYKSTVKSDYRFMINIRRELVQWYQYVFFRCVKKAFGN